MVDYFYMGIANRELESKINIIDEEIQKELKECKIQVGSSGIGALELDDMKMLNAFVKSKAEQAKATQIYTTMIGFGVGILAILLKELLLLHNPWLGYGMLLVVFIGVFGTFIWEEKRYRNRVQRLYYLSNLLDIYISRSKP